MSTDDGSIDRESSGAWTHNHCNNYNDHDHRRLSFPSHSDVPDDHHHHPSHCQFHPPRAVHAERISACESMIQLATRNAHPATTTTTTGSNDASFPASRLFVPKGARDILYDENEMTTEEGSEYGATVVTNGEDDGHSFFAEEEEEDDGKENDSNDRNFEHDDGLCLLEDDCRAHDDEDDDDDVTAFLRHVDCGHHDLGRDWNEGMTVEVQLSTEGSYDDDDDDDDEACGAENGVRTTEEREDDDDEDKEFPDEYDSEYSDSEGEDDSDDDDSDDDDSEDYREEGTSVQDPDEDPLEYQDRGNDGDEDQDEDDMTTDSCSSTSASGSSNSSRSFENDGRRTIKKQPPPHELFLPVDTSPTFEHLKYDDDEEEDDDSSDDSDSSDEDEDEDDEVTTSSPPHPHLSHYPHRTYMVRPRMMLPTRHQQWNAPTNPRAPSPRKTRQPTPQKTTTPKPSHRKDRVSFHHSVTVYPVFQTSSYPPSLLSQMYTQRDELRTNKTRNKREYAYDGHDWRNATEEDDMSEGSDGELVHPVHRRVGLGAAVPSLAKKRERDSIVGVAACPGSAATATTTTTNSTTVVHRGKRMRMYYP